MSSEEPTIFNTTKTAAFSADVQIELFIDGQRFRVGQMGRDLLIFDKPVLLPGGEGELVLTIDGSPRRWQVSVPNGAAATRFIKVELREAD